MKPGDKVWLGPWNVIDDGEAILLDGPLMDDRVGDFLLCPPESELLPDHPALPAVARWLAALPDWISAKELSESLREVLVSSMEQVVALGLGGIQPTYERRNEFVKVGDLVQPHGWEALESLITALTEGQG